MPPPPTLIKVSCDSHLRYLPLVYLLPEDVIGKCPTLRTLPRKAREIVYNESMMAMVESDQFFNEIADTMAALTFPHFGFGGWKEDYAGESPIWKLSYALPVWARAVEAESGWSLQSLFLIPSSQRIPFFHPDYIKDLMRRVVIRVISEEGWQPVFDVMRKMPCDEDFEKRDTNVRKDFLRKWYHTRSKRVKSISLEALTQNDEGDIVFEIEDTSSSYEDSVVATDLCQQFKARLSERDMTILELRIAGFTYEEIAGALGYKNHSGVIKRIQSIAKALIKYEEEQQ